MAKVNKEEIRTIADCDKDINEIDSSIEKLLSDKKLLVAERFKLLGNQVEVPLNQLNLIARLGVDKAKEMLGDKFV